MYAISVVPEGIVYLLAREMDCRNLKRKYSEEITIYV